MAATKAATAKKQTKAASVKVTVTQNYYDLQRKELKHVGDSFEADSDRAAELKNIGLVEY